MCCWLIIFQIIILIYTRQQLRDNRYLHVRERRLLFIPSVGRQLSSDLFTLFFVYSVLVFIEEI